MSGLESGFKIKKREIFVPIDYHSHLRKPYYLKIEADWQSIH